MNITESAVRSRAKRLGFFVRKSRRDGSYALFDATFGHPVFGFWDGYAYGTDLDSIADFLAAD